MNDVFELARKAAEKSSPQVTKYRHSSIIIDRTGKILSTGYNHFAGKRIQIEDSIINKTIHSEAHALTKVNLKKLDNSVIINYGRTNISAILSRPCPNCWTILKKLGFKKMFYTVRSDLKKSLWKEEYF